MKLTLKSYKIQKTKNHIKKHSFFFFISSSDKQSSNYILLEQELKKLNLNSFKVLNRLTIKTLKTSVYNTFTYIISSSTVFLTPSTKLLIKSLLLSSVESLVLVFILVKLNNKFYYIKQLKDLYSLYYSKNTLMLFQLSLTKLKFYLKQN